MPDEALVVELKGRLPDEFSRTMLEGALHVLRQHQNPMRAQQFAATLRELITHVLQSLAPDADVARCSWYKQDQNTDGPVRRQRALYTCRGGLSDDFMKHKLGVDPKALHSEFSQVFQQLHKRTHVRADTLLTDPAEIEDFANEVIGALADVFDTIDDVRARILDAVSVELHGEATSAFINQTIEELGEISTHYETGTVWIDDVEVISLDADRIEYRVKGNVDVTLMYGSGSDRANDLGAEIAESYPYDCRTRASTSDPTKFEAEETTMKVDTGSWHGDGEPD
jgi:hypothetical protein